MYLSSIRVKNFRSIRDETLPFERLTALIGANGAEKSSFLQALNLFYQPVAAYTIEDFYNKDTTENIIIAVTFAGLSDEEREFFKKYIEGDNFTVENVMTWPVSRNSQKYHGRRLKNPNFDDFRRASGASELRNTYNHLRNGEYPELPEYSKKDAAETALQRFEEAHPDQCIRQRDEGQFFGFKEVGEAHLERFSRFIYVPPVREAAKDAADGKNSVMSELLDLIVRKALMSREDIQMLQRETQSKYDAIVNPENLQELTSLGDQLTETLKQYAPGTSVSIDWSRRQEITIPPPEGRVKLIEDDYPSPVDNTGHGLQRAFIITLLQHLALVQAKTGEEEHTETPEGKQNLILGIEEPELYQHPNRQRHLASILERLCSDPETGKPTSVQVIYSTHSPLFIDIRHFERIRIVRKVKKSSDLPKETKIKLTTPEAVQTALNEIEIGGRSSCAARPAACPLEYRLTTAMTPIVNEGFFSDVVVLVEGEEDRAALVGVAKISLAKDREIDLDACGISVIPCHGKDTIPKVGTVFKHLEIPIYVVWDNDRDKQDKTNPGANHRLLRLCGQPEEDWPEGIFEQYACFGNNLTELLRHELGEDFYDRVLDDIRKEFNLGNKKGVEKNPFTVTELIKRAKDEGRSSPSLEKIVKRIVALRGIQGN